MAIYASDKEFFFPMREYKGRPLGWKKGQQSWFNFVRAMPSGQIVVRLDSPNEMRHRDNVVDFRKNYMDKAHMKVEPSRLKPKLLVLVYDESTESVFRGQLMSGLDRKYEVTLLAVDFGILVKRRGDFLYYMTEKYMKMPFDSQLIHLDGLEFFEGCDIFKEIIESHTMTLIHGTFTGMFTGIGDDGLPKLRFTKLSKTGNKKKNKGPKAVDVNRELLKALYARCPTELPKTGNLSKLAKISCYEWNSETNSRPTFYLQFLDSFNMSLRKKLDAICFDKLEAPDLCLEPHYTKEIKIRKKIPEPEPKHETSSSSSSSDSESKSEPESVKNEKELEMTAEAEMTAIIENEMRDRKAAARKALLAARKMAAELIKEKDEIYIARFKGSIYRAKFVRITDSIMRSILHSDSGESGDDDDGNDGEECMVEVPMAEVWFMDFGNRVILPIENIKKAKWVDPHLAKIPPMCHKVYLKWIYKIANPEIFNKEASLAKYYFVNVLPEVIYELPVVKLMNRELNPKTFTGRISSFNKLMVKAGICLTSRSEVKTTVKK